ncbi:DUF423 domain-containing protein [Alicyclobacillaceae bacterium I2511]|nr:DUF423 domain-containing protein [Alicyclobacillaceae bacterium I2511]
MSVTHVFPIYAAVGAIFGFFAVALGAFAAHLLKERVTSDKLAVFQTGVQYQMYHSLALIGVSLLQVRLSPSNPGVNLLGLAGLAFVLGILLFSGSLYVLTFVKVRTVGLITPLGGVLFLLGWVFVVLGALH